MTSLANSATAITASLNREDVLHQILEQTKQALQVEAVSLALIDQKKKELVFEASTSIGKYDITGLRLTLDQGIVGWVALEGKGVIVPDVHQDPRFFSGIDQTTGFTTSAIACAPIRFSGEVIGVLEAINPTKGAFDSDALMVLTGIGSLAGSALRHSQHFSDLNSAHERYRDLFENNINSMLLTDWKGKIVEANHETVNLSGYNRETLQEMEIGQLHELNLDKLGENFNNLYSEATITYETEIHTKSGIGIPIEVRAHSIQVDDSSIIQWVFRSIKERKELDQFRDDLLSSIYHDLRSPLSNVVSSMDVLANMLELDGNPAILSLFNIAVRSTERIQRLTNSLLDINRLEAGQPIVNLQLIDPKSLVQDTLDTVSPIAKNKGQVISAELTDDLPLIHVDGDMIRRVIINLTENAVKFAPPDGSIKIGARPDGEWVTLWVEDSGPGIPPEKRETIFDKFTRLHGHDGPAGFGLGLAYCRFAVEGHGGRIWIEDASEEGVRFVFNLPVGEDP